MRLMFILALLLLLLFSTTLEAPHPPPSFNALCIGVNYSKPNNDRQWCPYNRDAVIIHNTLTKFGANSQLLYGDDATYQKACDGLQNMVAISKPGDVNFILFSTHGSFGYGSDEKDYGARLHDKVITGTKIMEYALQMRGIVIIAVDTCRAGSLLNHKTPDNIIIFASCHKEQGASWIALSKLSDDEPCGYLSKPIGKAFSGKADLNGNGHLEVFELVAEIVAAEQAEDPARRQNPTMRVPYDLLTRKILDHHIDKR